MAGGRVRGVGVGVGWGCVAPVALVGGCVSAKRRSPGPCVPMQSFLGFWVFQMIWVWGTSVSFVFALAEPMDTAFEWRDVLGIVLWGARRAAARVLCDAPI